MALSLKTPLALFYAKWVDVLAMSPNVEKTKHVIQRDNL